MSDVASDQADQGLRANLIYDRDTASRLGITPNMIDQTLYDAYGQRQVSTMFTQLNQYHVVLELMPGFQRNPLELRDLYIRTGAPSSTGTPAGVVSGGSSSTALSTGPSNTAANASTTIVTGNGTSAASAVFNGAAASSAVFPNGGQVPLAAFSQMQLQAVPITVNHQGQFPVVTLSFNLAPKASLGEAVTAVNKVQDETADAGQRSRRVSRHGRGLSGVPGE